MKYAYILGLLFFFGTKIYGAENYFFTPCERLFPFRWAKSEIERFDYLKQRISDKPDFSQIAGIHGASLETLVKLIETGVIGRDAVASETTNLIFFYPTDHEFNSIKAPDGDAWGNETSFTREEALDAASGYSRLSAVQHFFLSELHLRPDVPELYRRSAALVGLLSTPQILDRAMKNDISVESGVDYKTFNEHLQFFEGIGLSRNRLISTLAQSQRKRKGVIIGFSEEIYRLKVSWGGSPINDPEGLRLHIPPEGLSIKAVKSITLLGDEEKNYFETRPLE